MNTTMATNLKYDIVGAHNVRDFFGGGIKQKTEKLPRLGNLFEAIASTGSTRVELEAYLRKT